MVTAVEALTRIPTSRAAYAGLHYLWLQPDFLWKLVGCVYCVAKRSVLLCGCETWSLIAQNAHRLETLCRRCLCIAARIGWSDGVSNVQIGNLVLGVLSECWLSERRLRGLSRVIHVANIRLP